MSIETIESEYYKRYPAFKYHNMKFWLKDGQHFCQAFAEKTKEFYGNIFQCNVSDFTFNKVV